MKLAIGCDHAGYALKARIIETAKNLGHEIIDMGCHGEASVDYPDYAVPACKEVLEGRADRAILLCYTGVGMSMAANKVRGIRCALVGDTLTAKLTRQHNDSNVLALGAGIIGAALAEEILTVWLATPTIATEPGRHKNRVEKLMNIERLMNTEKP
ncbi:MAG: ribose 5-phosphate isomerase B [Clostridiales bacterium]|jgi:ribose 5-phosphate isomerase B|nr:ribose 5-phosphate isomerase B [Clostridiales bacterium]